MWFKRRGAEESWDGDRGADISNDASRLGLPKLPSLPALPSFPKSESGDDASIQAVKSMIGLPPGARAQSYPQDYSQTSQIFQKPASQLIPSMMPSTASVSPASANPFTREAEPIFVKIDKFKEAVENFAKVKEKISDIEAMLAKIKELKEKEEQELGAWEREVQMMKSRVESIDNSLFKRVGS